MNVARTSGIIMDEKPTVAADKPPAIAPTLATTEVVCRIRFETTNSSGVRRAARTALRISAMS